MARYYGSSAERGYGTAHQKLRRVLMKAWRPGDPCARCGRPMWDKKRIDLGHTDDRTGYRGLEHAYCNRRAGAGNANRAGRQPKRIRPPGRDYAKPCPTCGSVNPHPVQACEICGGHFHRNNSRVQYTCSRACGVEFRRRNMAREGWRPRTICACGSTKSAKSARCAKCRETAAREAAEMRRLAAAAPRTRIRYYTCRYCGELKVAKATGQQREVCASPACQARRLNENRERHDGRPRPVPGHAAAA